MPDDPTFGAKIATMLLLGLGSFVMGIAPLKVAKWLRIRRQGVPTVCGYPHADATGSPPLMSLLLFFGGGVLLNASLLHLLPEVSERAARLQRAGWLPARAGAAEHLGALLLCAGFLVVFAADELVHGFVDRHVAGRQAAAAGGDRVALQRTASMRRRPVCAPHVAGEEDAGALEAIIASNVRPGQNCYRPAATAAAIAEERRLRALEQERRAAEEAAKIADGLTGSGRHTTRGLLAVVALSFPQLLVGLAVGLEERADRAWCLCAAAAVHRLVVTFNAGLEMTWCCNVRRSAIVAYAAAFSATAPVGVVLGMALSRCGAAVGGVAVDGTPGCVAVAVQALAAGTLLYVLFFEVLARHKQTGIWCPLCIVVGFAVMMVLQTVSEYIFTCSIRHVRSSTIHVVYL